MVDMKYNARVSLASDELERARPPGKIVGSFQLWSFGGIDDGPVATHDRARCQVCLIDVRSPEDVHHALSRREEIVGDDPPVATPPDGFRAHDRASVLSALLSKSRQAQCERRRQRVVGVIPKATHPPICVKRELSVACSAPKATKFGNMLIADLPRG